MIAAPRALVASFAAALAACGGAPSSVEPATVVIESAGPASVVVDDAPVAPPAASMTSGREAMVAKELADLDEQMVRALRPAPSASPSTGPKAVISIMGPAVSGGPVANAGPVVAGMAAGFRRCVNRELSANPTSVKNGNVVLLARIGVNGEVLSVAPSGGATLPTAAIACLQARVMSAQFAPPASGSAKIEIPLMIDLI